MYYYFELLDKKYYIFKNKLTSRIRLNLKNFKGYINIREENEKLSEHFIENLEIKIIKKIEPEFINGTDIFFGIAQSKMTGNFENNKELLGLLRYLKILNVEYEFKGIDFRKKEIYIKINDVDMLILSGEFGLYKYKERNYIKIYNDKYDFHIFKKLRDLINDKKITYISTKEKHLLRLNYIADKPTQNISELIGIKENIKMYEKNYNLRFQHLIELYEESYKLVMKRLEYEKNYLENRKKDNLKEYIELVRKAKEEDINLEHVFNDKIISYREKFDKNEKNKEEGKKAIKFIKENLKKMEGELNVDNI